METDKTKKVPFPDARKLRRSLRPLMSMCEMARKLGISHDRVYDLESGFGQLRGWPLERKQAYLSAIEDWKKNPTPIQRKIRSDKGISFEERRARREQELHAVA